MLLTGVQAGLPERAKLQDEVVSSRRYELRQRSSCSMGVSVQQTLEWRRNPQEEMVAREKYRTWEQVRRDCRKARRRNHDTYL